MLDARLLAEPFDPALEYARFIHATAGAGAAVTFTGFARPTSHAGDALDRLFLDHHPRLTQASLDAIGSAAIKRFALNAACILHRCGEIAPGEPIVFVGAAAPHRRAAFDAVDQLMDSLKTDAVFWKREDSAAGSAWIEPTGQDRAARARWSA